MLLATALPAGTAQAQAYPNKPIRIIVPYPPGGFNDTLPPDGHTLFIVPFAFAVNPSIFKKLPYDPAKDFAPIALAATTPNLLVVGPSMPARTLTELVAQAAAKPGALNYASTGIGSSNHLSMEKFKQMAHLDITHVPYKGSATPGCRATRSTSGSASPRRAARCRRSSSSSTPRSSRR